MEIFKFDANHCNYKKNMNSVATNKNFEYFKRLVSMFNLKDYSVFSPVIGLGYIGTKQDDQSSHCAK